MITIPNDSFCVLPWISLEASPIGTVRPCCLADDEILDASGNKYELANADLDEVRNSEHMSRLRQQFLQGEKPQTCRKCWQEEKSNRISKRMHTLNRLKHTVNEHEWTTDPKSLMFLDLKLGNICNLKCRICGSWSSSQFATEELNDIRPDERKFHAAYRMLRQGAWPKTSEHFWQQLEKYIHGIRYIEFTGGEPFMIQEHFDLLKRIRDSGHASQIEIHYNTNGTIFPDHAIEIWTAFRTVEIAFSIDDVDARFEYQRTNAQWHEVSRNIERFVSLRDQHHNIKLQVCTTVNIFNVLYLSDVAAWIDTKPFDFVYWNMMHDAWYFSIGCLPDHVKDAVATRLLSHDFGRHQQEIQRVCEFMHKGASTDGFMTRMKINDLDRKRTQDLRAVAPELTDLLGYAPDF